MYVAHIRKASSELVASMLELALLGGNWLDWIRRAWGETTHSVILKRERERERERER